MVLGAGRVIEWFGFGGLPQAVDGSCLSVNPMNHGSKGQAAVGFTDLNRGNEREHAVFREKFSTTVRIRFFRHLHDQDAHRPPLMKGGR
jgi:hypothetical protein